MATIAPSAALPVMPPAAGTGAPSLPKLIGFIMMVFGMFMAILDIQIVSASLQKIQAGLSASSDEIVWVQASYLIAEIIMIPLSGFLSRALSTRWLFALSSAGFTVASALCATSNSIETMVVYRAIQGFLGGAMIPTVYGAMFTIFGRNRQVGVTVVVSLIVTMAPTIGPVLGGWITESFSWHWLFLINIVPGIAISVAVFNLVDIDKPNFALLKKIDIPGLILLALFLGGLEYVLEEGARKQWLDDSGIRNWLMVTIVAGGLFFYRTLTTKEPIVQLRPFGNYNFAAGSVMAALMGVGLYGMTYLYPLYLSQVAQLSSGQIGNVLFVSGVSMMVSAPFCAMIARRFDARLVAALGMMIMAISTWMTQGVTADWRFHEFLLPQILRGSGLMLCMVSLQTTAFGTLPQSMIKDGAGLFTLMRNLGGAIGLAMINTVLLWRTNFHWSRLVDNVSLSRPEVQAQIDGMAARMESMGVSGDPTAAAIYQLNRMVLREVSVLSFADCFYLLSVMFVCAAFLPVLLRKPMPVTIPAEAH
jgi:MFS transporter, DHA2 family, multidrug resistance protein